jgi:dihydropyrimidinase
LLDLGILNGKIYLEGQWFEGNIYIKNGKVSTISKDFCEAVEEYDAQGNCILPGFIDPHVHFALNCGKYTSADDFYSGTKAAAFGGITTIIDFLDPISHSAGFERALSNRLKLAEKSVIDYSFHTTIANLIDEPIELIKKTTNSGIPTIKLFTTYSTSNRRTPDKVIDSLLQMSKENKITLLVHAENDGLVQEGLKLPIAELETSRPAIAELSEVLKLAEMTRYRDGRMYIVHTSCGTTVERLKENYSDILNKNFILESCPHYFIFSRECFSEEKGFLYTMTPPLRSSEEISKLKNNIEDIFVIGTDHCPFNSFEKNAQFLCDVPMGIGGIEHSFSIMYYLFGDKIIDRYTKNPALAHGLYPKKGNLYPGADGDIVIFNPGIERVISKWNSKADYSVYEGIRIKGKILSTLSRGRFIVKEGLYSGGKGEFVRREV